MTLWETYQYFRKQICLECLGSVRYCSWFWTYSEGHKVNISCHQVISIFKEKGWFLVLVWGRGQLLPKGCGETFSEVLISESRFEEWDTVSCVKILKKRILGRRASSHVMRQEQEQCVKELQMVECNWSAVIEGQNRDKRLRLERQRWGLVGTCRVRAWILSNWQWRAARWFDKGKW